MVKSDDQAQAFTELGDSGSLVTGVDADNNAYGIHQITIEKFSLVNGDPFKASIISRLDINLDFLHDQFGIKLTFM